MTEGQIARQLRWALRPFQPLLDDTATTDLHINGAGPDGETAVFIKRKGRRERRTVRLSARELESIGIHAAVLGRSRISERMPFSPGRFPDGQRIQIARSPAVPEGRYALSIRRASSKSPTPELLESWGVFDMTEAAENARPRIGTDELLALKAGKKWRLFLETAFRYGYSGVFAGPVNSGKTTNMRAFFHAIPLHKRIITVQDAEELDNMPQEDVVHLLYPKDTGGIAQHTAEGCIEAGLRMDMDEVINGEIRDGAAWALMRAGGSGHSFKTSCHAPSAEGAFSSILRMAKQHPVARSFDNDDLMQALRSLIDFVAFSEDIDGQRRITQVWFDPAAKTGLPKTIAAAMED
jgi:type IV secretion system protein VirB11